MFFGPLPGFLCWQSDHSTATSNVPIEEPIGHAVHQLYDVTMTYGAGRVVH